MNEAYIEERLAEIKERVDHNRTSANVEFLVDLVYHLRNQMTILRRENEKLHYELEGYRSKP